MHRRIAPLLLPCRRPLVGALLAGFVTALLGGLFIGNLLVGAPEADAGSASITLSASEGAAGTILDIEGRGFPRRASGQVRFGGRSAGMPDFRTNARGGFSASIVVPDVQPGEYRIGVSVRRENDGDSRGVAESARFVVTGTRPAPPSDDRPPRPTPPPPPANTPRPRDPDHDWQLVGHSTFEGGGFDESNTSLQDGSLTVQSGGPGAAEGGRYAKAVINGSGNNAFSRTQWSVDWGHGTTYRTEISLFLPHGTYDALEGSFQVVGWDTWPVANNQMRLIVWDTDKKARLFVKTDGQDRVISNTFSIPEGRWVRIAIEQKIADQGGWSKVFMDGQLMAEGQGDTATPHTIKYIRYGMVAMDPGAQRVPLTVLFDDVKLLIAS
jgi:hypothetical protein